MELAHRWRHLVNEQIFQELTPPLLQSAIYKGGRRITGRKAILLACFPKSGSTFISRTLHELPGFAKLSAVPIHDRREQELDSACIRNLIGIKRHAIYQHHVRWSAHTERVIRDHDMHLVVLTRHLGDVCQSLSDHLDEGGIEWFNMFLDEELLAYIDQERRRPEFLVDLALPWYINFYVGWQRYAQRGGQVQWIDYQALQEDETAVFRAILDGAEITDISDDDLRIALDTPRFTRQNVGRAGRGEQFFSDFPEARTTLERYLAYYPEIDFSPVVD